MPLAVSLKQSESSCSPSIHPTIIHPSLQAPCCSTNLQKFAEQPFSIYRRILRFIVAIRLHPLTLGFALLGSAHSHNSIINNHLMVQVESVETYP